MNRLAVVSEGLTASCTRTSASTTVSTADTSLILGAVGVTGTGIPPKTVVTAILSATTFSISQAATASGSSALSFGIEPIMLDEAKLQCRQDATTLDDLLIASLITAARRTCENDVKRSFLTTTYDLFLDHFPCYACGGLVLEDEVIELDRPSALAVTEIVYTAGDGTSTTLASNQYRLTPGIPGTITPAYGVSWPTARGISEAVRVRYTAGYGSTAAAVPDNVKAAIKLMVGHLYENREAVLTTGAQPVALPMAVDALLAPERWGGYR